ncbi:hypothetical protein [uncultured Amnibacterium sp.]|uniref:hypothetical protein n=1 Tax=uncultured Amnibacterium sp. TaxID=1631851 RepID=UPI0035CA868C
MARLLGMLICVALALTGCTIAVSDPGRTTAAGTPSTTDRSSASALPTVPRYNLAGVPEVFPMVPGSIARVYRDNTTYAISGSIRVRDPGAAYRFWVQRLPLAGYRVHAADFLDGYGQIRVSGHGCDQVAGSSTVRLTFTGTNDVHYTCTS